MIERNGVIWAYRYILNREPESEEAINVAAGSVSSPLELRRLLRKSREFSGYLERAGQPFVSHATLDWREGIIWAYRLLLDRDPTESELEDGLGRENSVNDVRLRILLSQEREGRWPGLDPLADFSILNAFAPFPAKSPVADAFVDFLGSATKTRYLDPLNGLDGYVYRGVPRAAEAGHHGTSEWIGTLRSTLEAGGSFTAMELGAGWAPWLVVARRASALLGIADVSLTGVEASEEHYHYMVDHLTSNGIDPQQHALHRAIAAPEDGVAMFPRLFANHDYGANAAFNETERKSTANFGELEEIKALSLNTLLRGKARVDLIHIDIQGHELEVVKAGIEALNATTRRMVIGTHSRTIDGNMMDFLHGHGWICESESPCRLARNPNGSLRLSVDGEQVWRNDRIPVIAGRLAAVAH
jgi:FkbM family methyltransferase